MTAGGRRGACSAALALALIACSVEPDDVRFPDQARFVAFGRAHALEIACEDGWARAAGERLALRPRRGSELQVRVTAADARRGSGVRRLLLTGPDAPAARRVLEVLDGELAAFVHARDARGGALIATLPDPEDGQQALTVCLAWSGSELVDPGRDLDLERLLEPTWRIGWQRFEGALCTAASDGSPPRTEPPPAARTCAQWSALEPDRSWLAVADTDARAAVVELLGEPPRPFPDARVRLWESAHALGRVVGGAAPSFVRPAAGVLELARDADAAVARGALAELYARAAFGEPRQRLLADALAVRVSGAWWGRDLERWCARLAAPPLAIGLEDLERDAGRVPHRALPLSALALDVLRGLRGAAAVRRAWNEGGSIDAELSAAFSARLAGLSAGYGEALRNEARQRRMEVRMREFRGGVNLVLERSAPGREEARHGSPQARAALERARELGADAVAIDWVEVLRPSARELAWGAAQARRPWAGDYELAGSARAARELGLRVLFKPHLWISASGTFAGAALSYSEQDLQRYFEALRELTLQSALLAELCGAEILCLAAEQRMPSFTRDELGGAGWDAEHYAWKRARWSDLIAAARAAFDGGLTYAAHWDGEPFGIAFWDQLDFVGLDLFAPIEPRPQAPDAFDLQAVRAELWNRLHWAQGVAGYVGRSLLVTEFGYPLRAGEWTRPERPSGEVDPLRQAQVLETLADVLALVRRNPTPLAGVYLWNLPIEGSSAYAVGGPASAAAVRRVFARP
jgi:hypothetical protein